MYIILSILNRFNLFNFNASFLWPQRNEAERNSRRRFSSHENCIIQQLSLTTRDFVYFLMFQNHSNSSTLCFINILGSLRYCRFLVTWYLLYFIYCHCANLLRKFAAIQKKCHLELVSRSKKEIPKRVRNDSILDCFVVHFIHFSQWRIYCLLLKTTQ